MCALLLLLSLAPLLGAQQPDQVPVTHKGISQDSHLRFWPGGGGVSPNKYPFLPVWVPSDQKEPPGQPCPPRWCGLRRNCVDILRRRDAMMRPPQVHNCQ